MLPWLQLEHPALPLGLAAAQPCLDLLDRGRVDAGEQPVGLGPGLLGGVPGDGVHPDAEADLAALVGGELADPVDLLAHGGGRLAPGQVDVGVLGGDVAGGGRGAAEVDLGDRVGDLVERGVLDLEVLAVEGHGLAAPQRADDVQELLAAGVAGVLVEEVAEHPLLVALAAGHHVEQQPAAGEVLEGAGHLGGQERRGQARAERDQELQPLGDLAEHRGREPGVVAPGAGGGQRGLEADVLGGPGDLAEVGHARRATRGTGADAVAAADDVAAVATVGGQEPVELQRHGVPLVENICLLSC